MWKGIWKIFFSRKYFYRFAHDFFLLHNSVFLFLFKILFCIKKGLKCDFLPHQRKLDHLYYVFLSFHPKTKNLQEQEWRGTWKEVHWKESWNVGPGSTSASEQLRAFGQITWPLRASVSWSVECGVEPEILKVIGFYPVCTVESPSLWGRWVPWNRWWCFVLFFGRAPVACRSFQARDGTLTTTVTMLNP